MHANDRGGKVRVKIEPAENQIRFEAQNGIRELENIVAERARHCRAVVSVAFAEHRNERIGPKTFLLYNALRLPERFQEVLPSDDELKFKLTAFLHEPHDWLQAAVIRAPLGNK